MTVLKLRCVSCCWKSMRLFPSYEKMSETNNVQTIKQQTHSSLKPCLYCMFCHYCSLYIYTCSLSFSGFLSPSSSLHGGNPQDSCIRTNLPYHWGGEGGSVFHVILRVTSSTWKQQYCCFRVQKTPNINSEVLNNLAALQLQYLKIR